jgi:ribA/ribD-fused uncharacterized protein
VPFLYHEPSQWAVAWHEFPHSGAVSHHDMVGERGLIGLRYFNWIKAVTFDDGAQADKIAVVQGGDPAQCRLYGRQVAGFDQRKWDEQKQNMMEGGLFAKFWCPLIFSREGEDLLGKLLNTGERELVYAVEDDRVWGIGYRPGDAEKNRGKWGENLLGKALMGARAHIVENIRLGVCRGHMIGSREERSYRAAVMLGKMKWDKDSNLEVVEEKCTKGEELEVIKKMAKVARDGPETCLAKDIVRRMRKGRAHEEDCSCGTS